MEIKAIRTDAEHLAALAEIESLWGTLPGTEDGDRLDLLIALVEIYEGRRWPIDARRRRRYPDISAILARKAAG